MSIFPVVCKGSGEETDQQLSIRTNNDVALVHPLSLCELVNEEIAYFSSKLTNHPKLWVHCKADQDLEKDEDLAEPGESISTPIETSHSRDCLKFCISSAEMENPSICLD
jgi:GTPase involved in cell partitioning and DNA repair